MPDYYHHNKREIRDFEDYVNKYYEDLRRVYWRTKSQMQFIDFCHEKCGEYLKNNNEMEYGL